MWLMLCHNSGFDGRFRERQRETTIEAALVGGEGETEDGAHHVIAARSQVPSEIPLTPGGQAVLRLSAAQLEMVVQDQGLVLLSVMQPEAMQPQQTKKGGGSYASLAQAFGVQRLGDGQGGFVRVIAQQRVLVQVNGPGIRKGSWGS